MKRLILSVLTFIVALSSISLANCIGDISQIGNASCITKYSDDTDIEDMDTVTFGSYPQSSSSSKEPIEWVVLDKQDDKALLLSKYILDYVRYSKTGNDSMESSTWRWENSNLRQWLNNNFLSQAFNSDEKNCLINDKSFGDKVFIFSREMLKKYFNIYSYNWLNGMSLEAYTPDDNFDINYYYRFDSEIQKLNVIDTEYSILSYNNDERIKNGWMRSYEDRFDDEYCVNIYYDKGTNHPNFINGSSIGRSEGVIDDFGPVGVRPAIWVSLSNTQSNDSQTNSNSAGYVTEEGWIKANPNMPGGVRDLDKAGKATVTRSAWEQLPEDLKSQFREDQIIDDINENSSSQNIQETTKVQETKPAPKNGWVGDYYYQNDVPVKNTWVDYGSDKYYCGSTGGIVKNQWIDSTYYVDSTGKMLKNTITPDGYKVGSDGKYIKETKDITTNQSTNNILGDNVHIEGADVFLNPDGSFQVGGTPEEEAIMVQGGGNNNSSSTTNDNYYNISLTKDDIKSVNVKEESQYFLFFKTGTEYKLNIHLTDAGNRKLKEASERNIGQSLYLVYDGKLLIDFKVDKVFNNNEGISVPYDFKEQAQDRMNKINVAKSVYLVEGDYQSFINNENSARTNKNSNNKNEDDDIVKPSGTRKIYGSRKNNDTKEVKTNLKGTYVNIGKDCIKLKLTKDIIKSMTVERENIDGIALDSTINNILFSDDKTDKCFIKIILDFSHIPLQSEMQEMQKFLSECYTGTIFYDGGDPDNEDNKIIKSLSIEDSMVFSPDIVKLYVKDEEKAEKVIKYINNRFDNYGKSTIEIYYKRWDLEKGCYLQSPKLIGASEIEIVPGNAIIPAKAYLKFNNEIKENFNKAIDEHKHYKYLVLVMPDFAEANIKRIEKFNISEKCPISNYQFVAYRFNNLSKESIKFNKIEINIEDVVGHPFMNEDADIYYSMENMKKKAMEYPYVMILCDDVKYYVK